MRASTRPEDPAQNRRRALALAPDGPGATTRCSVAAPLEEVRGRVSRNTAVPIPTTPTPSATTPRVPNVFARLMVPADESGHTPPRHVLSNPTPRCRVSRRRCLPPQIRQRRCLRPPRGARTALAGQVRCPPSWRCSGAWPTRGDRQASYMPRPGALGARALRRVREGTLPQAHRRAKSIRAESATMGATRSTAPARRAPAITPSVPMTAGARVRSTRFAGW